MTQGDNMPITFYEVRGLVGPPKEGGIKIVGNVRKFIRDIFGVAVHQFKILVTPALVSLVLNKYGRDSHQPFTEMKSAVFSQMK